MVSKKNDKQSTSDVNPTHQYWLLSNSKRIKLQFLLYLNVVNLVDFGTLFLNAFLSIEDEIERESQQNVSFILVLLAIDFIMFFQFDMPFFFSTIYWGRNQKFLRGE